MLVELEGEQIELKRHLSLAALLGGITFAVFEWEEVYVKVNLSSVTPR